MIGSYDGIVYAWSENGTSYRAGMNGVLFETGEAVKSTAALADLNENSLPEVIIGSDDNLIHIVDPSNPSLTSKKEKIVLVQKNSLFDEKVRWKDKLTEQTHLIYQIPKMLDLQGDFENIPTPAGDVYASPAVVDLNDDGPLDIIIGTEDNKIYAFDMNGTIAGLARQLPDSLSVHQQELEILTGMVNWKWLSVVMIIIFMPLTR